MVFEYKQVTETATEPAEKTATATETAATTVAATEKVTESTRVLHTPSAFAKENLLYVQEVGRLKSLKPHTSKREKLDSFLLLVVLEGSGSLTVGDGLAVGGTSQNGVLANTATASTASRELPKTYQLQKNDCVLIDCMQPYAHTSSEEDPWNLAWIHFNGHSARGYYELYLQSNQGTPVYHARTVAHFNILIGDLMEKQKERSFRSELSSGEILIHLLNDLVELSGAASVYSDEAKETQKRAEEIRKVINAEYASADLMKKLNEQFAEQQTEQNQLDQIFTKAFGIHIEEYLQNRRFNAAKELLRFTLQSPEEVAINTGIGSEKKLQELFQALEGMSAQVYRSKWAGWVRD